MPFRLPEALQPEHIDVARTYLTDYYALPPSAASSCTGAAFDSWDSTGTRDRAADHFTADDLVAVSFLSVTVGPRAAHLLLQQDAARFAGLLAQVGPDRDLADEGAPMLADGPEFLLHRALLALPDVGPTTASKLFARKRPRLRPIYDSVVMKVTDTEGNLWEPLRVALRASDNDLHHRLVALRPRSGLGASASPLRVLDVIAWMEGKAKGY